MTNPCPKIAKRLRWLLSLSNELGAQCVLVERYITFGVSDGFRNLHLLSTTAFKGMPSA